MAYQGCCIASIFCALVVLPHPAGASITTSRASDRKAAATEASLMTEIGIGVEILPRGWH